MYVENKISLQLFDYSGMLIGLWLVEKFKGEKGKFAGAKSGWGFMKANNNHIQSVRNTKLSVLNIILFSIYINHILSHF